MCLDPRETLGKSLNNQFRGKGGDTPDPFVPFGSLDQWERIRNPFLSRGKGGGVLTLSPIDGRYDQKPRLRDKGRPVYSNVPRDSS